MTELNDHELLAEFARSGSESAFATLVARHVNLVYSAALRFTGNPHYAQEVTQAVFIILVRKAGKLSRRVVLSGWLYQTARLTAANFMKSEIRRQQREQEAYMQSIMNEPVDAAWEQIAPLLEQAMGSLGDTDRNTVVLRFFENKTAAEMAAALNTTQAAAHKRVTRALEKLRKLFSKRGVTLSAVAIAGAVSANSVQAVPMGLAATVTATAAKGAGISTTITTLVKGTMKTMTWLKLKFVAGASIAALLAGGVATVAISDTIKSGDNLTPQAIAKQSQDAYAALTSYSDSGTVRVNSSGAIVTTRFNIRLQRPNFYRVDWTQSSGAAPTSQGVIWSDGDGDYSAMSAGKIDMKPEKRADMQMNFGAAAGVSSTAASTIPGIFYQIKMGNVLQLAAANIGTNKKAGEEKVGDTDCYVIAGKIAPDALIDKGQVARLTGGMVMATKLWIGKKDHLVHQIQQTVDASRMATPTFSDEDIKSIMEKLNKPATPQAIADYRTMMENAMKQTKKMGNIVFTQTHENIVVNQRFSPSAFKR